MIIQYYHLYVMFKLLKKYIRYFKRVKKIFVNIPYSKKIRRVSPRKVREYLITKGYTLSVRRQRGQH